MEQLIMKEKLNLKKSIELVNQGFQAHKKMCYDNTFANFIKMHRLKDKGHNIKVLFCYIHVIDNLYE